MKLPYNLDIKTKQNTTHFFFAEWLHFKPVNPDGPQENTVQVVLHQTTVPQNRAIPSFDTHFCINTWMFYRPPEHQQKFMQEGRQRASLLLQPGTRRGSAGVAPFLRSFRL